MKINSTGVIQWTSAVSTADSSQSAPRTVSDGIGGCIYVFDDATSDIEQDLQDRIFSILNDLLSDQTLIVATSHDSVAANFSRVLRIQKHTIISEEPSISEIEKEE